MFLFYCLECFVAGCKGYVVLAILRANHARFHERLKSTVLNVLNVLRFAFKLEACKMFRVCLRFERNISGGN